MSEDLKLPSDVEIRTLGILDLVSFVKLRKEIESESPYTPAGGGERKESLLYTLLKMIWHLKRTTTFIAIRDYEFVGYITVVFGRFRKFKGNAYISNVSVRESERGKGIGTALLREAEHAAAMRNSRRIELEVFSSNTNALNIYDKLGYIKEGIKKQAIELDGRYDDMVLMAKFLKQS